MRDAGIEDQSPADSTIGDIYVTFMQTTRRRGKNHKENFA